MVHTDDVTNSSEIVHSVLILIIKLCENIINANICMNDLMKCCKGPEPLPLQALCLAANSGKVSVCPDFHHVKSAMELCSKKFVFVQQYSKKIEVVVKYCSKISRGMYICTLLFWFTVCVCMFI